MGEYCGPAEADRWFQKNFTFTGPALKSAFA